MENIKELIEQYKGNYNKLERTTKEQTKEENKKKDLQHEKSELFYQLQDKKITAKEYNERHEEITKEEMATREKAELLLIEKKLLQDNENIIQDKMIIYLFNNVIIKYKNIGEKTAQKIDAEIKEILQDIFNDKYFTIYQYNDFRNYTPNQFINVFGCDYSFSNYVKKLVFNLTSHHNERNPYKQNIYINSNGDFMLNEYSKTAEEIEEDNKRTAERINNTETIQDTKAKAKAIYKAYKKKQKTLEELRKQEEETKKAFDSTIRTNQETYYHNLYSYFNQ